MESPLARTPTVRKRSDVPKDGNFCPLRSGLTGGNEPLPMVNDRRQRTVGLMATFGTGTRLPTVGAAAFRATSIVVRIGASTARAAPIPRQKRRVDAPIAKTFVETVLAAQHTGCAIIATNIRATAARVAARTMFVQIVASLLNPAAARLSNHANCKQASYCEFCHSVAAADRIENRRRDVTCKHDCPPGHGSN